MPEGAHENRHGLRLGVEMRYHQARIATNSDKLLERDRIQGMPSRPTRVSHDAPSPAIAAR